MRNDVHLAVPGERAHFDEEFGQVLLARLDRRNVGEVAGEAAARRPAEEGGDARDLQIEPELGGAFRRIVERDVEAVDEYQDATVVRLELGEKRANLSRERFLSQLRCRPQAQPIVLTRKQPFP